MSQVSVLKNIHCLVGRSCRGNLHVSSFSHHQREFRNLLLKAPQPKRAIFNTGVASFFSSSSSSSSSTTTTTPFPTMTVKTINPRLLKAEYAVRGLLPKRAAEIEKELSSVASDGKAGHQKWPFSSVVYANIGNPQAVGQKPITFFRQVLSLLEWDELLDEAKREDALKLFPADAIDRALHLRKRGVKMGAYTTSKGFAPVRDIVADFISERDGFAADPDKIFLTSGASAGISTILGMIIANSNVGVMLPIPQYPLYSATISLCDGTPVPYLLDEEKDWSMSVDTLQASLDRARAQGTDVRVLCVINPGNPTGQTLSQEVIEDVVRFCHREELVLCADEVYQTNTYEEDLPFYAFRKAVLDLGLPVELASFHSVSKGVLGECGRRGGCMELLNFDPFFMQQLEKRVSMNLCSNTTGQIMMGLACSPPKEGDPSHALYVKETSYQYESLRRRANLLADRFNSLEGVTCNRPMGSMYLFPQIRLPEKALAAAKAADLSPDTFYCLKLLESAGVCVVPGKGFGQKEGTFHFRCTFLPHEDQFAQFLQPIEDFHHSFMAEHS